MCTAVDMEEGIEEVLYGGAKLVSKSRIQCLVKSTFSETRLVPGLNDILFANPSPAAVSRFRMGWLEQLDDEQPSPSEYGTICRFGGTPYDVTRSLNIWSSGMWVCTSTGATAAMAAAGGRPMNLDSTDLQYLIREHIIENPEEVDDVSQLNNGMMQEGEKMHIRWNSFKGCIFIDGSHMKHNVVLGDEIVVDNSAPPLQMFVRN